MIVNKKKIFIFLALFLFIVNSLKGTIAIDFDELNENVTKVVTYNVGTQELISYDEISSNASWSKNVPSYCLTYKKGSPLIVSPTQQGDLLPLLVRFKGNLEVSMGGHTSNDSEYKIWSSHLIQEKDPQEIKKSLPEPLKKVSSEASLPITRLRPGTHTLATLSGEDKGNLGELVTTLTFLSFGYRQLPSKYEHNHGIDGIFQSLSGKYIFLTQSKRKSKPQTAENVVEHELNEPKIDGTIMEMEGYAQTRNTAELLKNFLDLTPHNVYKFGHRVTDSGKIQYHISPLEIVKFPKTRLKLTGATEAQKVKAIRNELDTYENTNEKQLDLLLKAAIGLGFAQDQVMERFTQIMNEKMKASTANLASPQQVPISLNPSPIVFPSQPSFSQNQSSVPAQVSVVLQGEDKSSYSREHLHGFLVYLTEKLKRSPAQISNQLSGIKGASKTTITRLCNDKNNAPTKEYDDLWNALKKTFQEDFKRWSS